MNMYRNTSNTFIIGPPPKKTTTTWFVAYTPPPTPHQGMGGGEGGGTKYWKQCPSVTLSVRLILSGDISRTAQPFLTKLGMVVYYHEAECHAEISVCYLQGQVTAKAYIIKI